MDARDESTSEERRRVGEEHSVSSDDWIWKIFDWMDGLRIFFLSAIRASISSHFPKKGGKFFFFFISTTSFFRSRISTFTKKKQAPARLLRASRLSLVFSRAPKKNETEKETRDTFFLLVFLVDSERKKKEKKEGQVYNNGKSSSSGFRRFSFSFSPSQTLNARELDLFFFDESRN